MEHFKIITLFIMHKCLKLNLVQKWAILMLVILFIKQSSAFREMSKSNYSKSILLNISLIFISVKLEILYNLYIYKSQLKLQISTTAVTSLITYRLIDSNMEFIFLQSLYQTPPPILRATPIQLSSCTSHRSPSTTELVWYCHCITEVCNNFVTKSDNRNRTLTQDFEDVSSSPFWSRES